MDRRASLLSSRLCGTYPQESCCRFDCQTGRFALIVFHPRLLPLMTDEAEDAFDQVMRSGNADAAELLRAMRQFLKENDMMAYLSMISPLLARPSRWWRSGCSVIWHDAYSSAERLGRRGNTSYGAHSGSCARRLRRQPAGSG
jgi:hypothetical protein